LVGFTLSPVLWRKLPGARSAGRVQSVALRLVCDRELEIETFVTQEYWSILVHLATPRNDVFEARLLTLDGRKMGRLDVKSAGEARAVAEVLGAARFSVKSVESRPTRRHPYPPFTTSTLQQEASRKLGLPPARTMQIAQRLYEGIDIGGETVGLITYMRTDGVDVAPEAIASIRKEIDRRHGGRYLPQVPRKYTVKAKNAQEAHEAIRPTDVSRHPADVSRLLDAEQAKLYDLIWKRTVASQMESAEIERTTVDILADAGARQAEVRATGSVVRFDGFLTLYQEGRDDDDDEENRRLPPMSEGEALTRRDVNTTQHFTEPPPRYTEASLIKKMEELGIGRPSTYSATLSVLRDREYVRLEKKRLVPEDKGRLVTAFLSSFFTRYVQYDFTASLEEQLDQVSAGEIDWREVLRRFWNDFSHNVEDVKDLRVSQVLDALNDVLGPHIFPAREDGGDPRACPSCGNGRLSLKMGKFGSFIGCSNYPECRYTRQIAKAGEGDKAIEGDGPKVLGTDPESGLEVSLRSGRFGIYVQLGEGEKPRRSSIPKGWEAGSLTLERALDLLHLPREVGINPENGEMITAGIGRFGPFINNAGVYANLPSVEDVFTVGINRAVTLLAEKKEKGGRGRGAAAPGRALGDHPTRGGAMVVRDGRYGPYVSWGKVNATLPKGSDPAALTAEEAATLVDAKAGKEPVKKAKAAPKTTKTAATRTKKAAEPAEGEAAAEKPKRKAATTRAKPAAT
ncbi:type I DNA topoisomerase, partial [Pseudoxanthobacter sp.]|uniref:type I DNA topoisomerase n=1 Tax=Pseudoxanthobacter sp. TaxID=1925742 RepID=UPI002FE1FE76